MLFSRSSCTLQGTTMNTITCPGLCGSRLFVGVDGLLGAGHFKSLLLLHRSNSTPRKVCDWVTRNQWSNRSTRSLAFLFVLLGEILCPISALRSDYHGQQSAKLHVKKTRHTLC